MVSYKKVLQSSYLRKPIKSIKTTISTFKHSETASLPFKLKIESSAICNLKCTMCPHNEKIGLKRNKGFLKFENFKHVFDQLKPCYLNLTGIGEPFLNPDIFKIVSYAKKHGAIIKFDTNATILTEENIKKILETKIDVLSISIDGAEKKSYEKIRIGADFDKVKNSIKALVKVRNETKSPTKVHMFFVLQESNISNLPKFIELANELNVDYLAGSFVVQLGKNKNKENKIKINKEKIKETLEKTKELLKITKTEVSISPLINYLQSPQEARLNYNKEKPCYMPWYSTFITWDGYVNPCDFSCDNEVVFGNAYQEPFKKIWNNDKLKAFRKQLLEKREIIPICANCGVDETYLEDEFKKIKKFIPFSKYLQYNIKQKQ